MIGFNLRAVCEREATAKTERARSEGGAKATRSRRESEASAKRLRSECKREYERDAGRRLLCEGVVDDISRICSLGML